MDRRTFLRMCAGGAAGILAENGPARHALAAPELRPVWGAPGVRVSPYFSPAEDGAVRCGLCPNACRIAEGGRGLCRVRENRGGRLLSLVYGNPCALNVDPVEKKPFFHVRPGTRSFSLATAGCNFTCKFCQNWEISQARPEDTANYRIDPAGIADLALSTGAASVAATYVEPTIFAEYMMDIGREARARGLLHVMHSNGFIAEGPQKDLCRVLDAACIDLKGFREDYYRDMCGGRLGPVLAALERYRAAGVHLELVTLLVPGANDAPEEIRAMCEWVRDRLGPDTPHHFTRFVPQYKLKSLPPTPVQTLEAAVETARRAGLRFVYVGNAPGHPAENTTCPACGAMLIRRTGYASRVEGLKDGACAACGRKIPGIW